MHQTLVVQGHFARMVCDRVTEIGWLKLARIKLFFVFKFTPIAGCAMTKFTKQGWKTILITCNYSSANIIGFLVYSIKTATKCVKGINPEYPGLCSEDEKVNPNLLKANSGSILMLY